MPAANSSKRPLPQKELETIVQVIMIGCAIPSVLDVPSLTFLFVTHLEICTKTGQKWTQIPGNEKGKLPYLSMLSKKESHSCDICKNPANLSNL